MRFKLDISWKTRTSRGANIHSPYHIWEHVGADCRQLDKSVAAWSKSLLKKQSAFSPSSYRRTYESEIEVFGESAGIKLRREKISLELTLPAVAEKTKEHTGQDWSKGVGSLLSLLHNFLPSPFPEVITLFEGIFIIQLESRQVKGLEHSLRTSA